MRQQGRAEFAALQAFLKAASDAKRTDLARFVLRTNAALFTERHDAGILDGRAFKEAGHRDWPIGSTRSVRR